MDTLRALDQQAQACVGSGVGATACRDHDVFGQFAKYASLGIGCQFLAFCFPLRAHV
jgi:hypothetical protein